MTDFRIQVGDFLCTDRSGIVILGMCYEYTDVAGEGRYLGSVMVPGKHIVKMEVDILGKTSYRTVHFTTIYRIIFSNLPVASRCNINDFGSWFLNRFTTPGCNINILRLTADVMVVIKLSEPNPLHSFNVDHSIKSTTSHPDRPFCLISVAALAKAVKVVFFCKLPLRANSSMMLSFVV
uniref:CSON013032 protein n=1 Tax=Culicoides sonorensis TaxID=179676 RepID=A0A336KND8_CULSO